jgi:hypothetical protein
MKNEYPTINPEDHKIIVYWEDFFESYVAHLDDPEHNFETHAYAQGTTPEMALDGLRDFLDELERDATDEGDEWP